MAFDWDMPYATFRRPVMAENVVATSQPLAAQAGLRALREGGSAMDAAIATALALSVLEPTSNGIGSDAFAIVWDGRRLHGFNGSGRSPRAWSPERFDGLDEMPMKGWETVTVPGAVDAWARLSERFGRLPFERLFDDVIHYARDGFPVAPLTASMWRVGEKAYKDFPDFGATFLRDGKAPQPGQRFRLPDHAATLEEIAATKGESFYRGRLAEAIVECSSKVDGAMSLDDLGDHRGEWVDTISVPYAGADIHELPPNGQGLAALIALGLLDRLDARRFPVDSADSVHLQVEAMKLALADTYQYVADPGAMAVSCADLLDAAYLDERAATIRLDRACEPAYGMPREHGTVYLTAADASGMMVSFIQSNYRGFGSGVVVPGTGIAMQNRGSGFTLEEGHANRVDGGKRPYHTIIPAFAMKGSQPLMSFGVMGGFMQPQGHAQMVVRTLDYNQNPQTALDAPRWQVTEDFRLALEETFVADVADELARRGHDVDRGKGPIGFGGGQIIWRMEDNAPCSYCAATEPRKDGQAVGF